MAKKSATQEANDLLLGEKLPLTNEESIIDATFSRPSLEHESLEPTASASSAISEGLKGIERIEFVRKNREQQKNLKKYFFGLLPIVGRKTVHVCGNITLRMFDGIPKEDLGGATTIIRDIGEVSELDDDEVLEALNKIKKLGLKFSHKNMTPSVFKITEENPSDHYWARGREFPLGQFCFFESVAHLNNKYGNESAWRSKFVPMRSLIARIPIPSGYQGVLTPEMGDGWSNHWPIKRKEEVGDDIFELSDSLIQSALR